MACETKTYTNILDLPQVVDITIGDFLIVEQGGGGTNIIDYKDVLWTLDNMTFSSTISSQDTRITTLSSQIQTLNTSVSSLSNKVTLTIKDSLGDTIILALSDVNTYNRLSNEGSTTIIITNLNWPLGTEITFRRTTLAGGISIQLDDNVILNDNLAGLISPGNTFMIKYIGNNIWDFI